MKNAVSGDRRRQGYDNGKSIDQKRIGFHFFQHITQDHILEISGNQQVAVGSDTGILLLDLIVHHIGDIQLWIGLYHPMNGVQKGFVWDFQQIFVL